MLIGVNKIVSSFDYLVKLLDLGKHKYIISCKAVEI